jgi:hypothetical protein
MARGSRKLGKVLDEASGGWFGRGNWWSCGRGLEGRGLGFQCSGSDFWREQRNAAANLTGAEGFKGMGSAANVVV